MSDVRIAWDYESNLTDENQAKSLAAQVSTNYQGAFLLKRATFKVEMEDKIFRKMRFGEFLRLSQFYWQYRAWQPPDFFRMPNLK
jgi:hypothetical protein